MDNQGALQTSAAEVFLAAPEHNSLLPNRKKSNKIAKVKYSHFK